MICVECSQRILDNLAEFNLFPKSLNIRYTLTDYKEHISRKPMVPYNIFMKDPVGSVSQLVMNIFKEIGADAYPMNAFAITSTNFIDARGLQDQSDLDKYLEERPTQPSEKKLLASEALKKNLKNIRTK